MSKSTQSPGYLLAKSTSKQARAIAAAKLAALRTNPSGGSNGGAPIKPAPDADTEEKRKKQREYRRKRRAGGKDL